jgi:hypothetical protein
LCCPRPWPAAPDLLAVAPAYHPARAGRVARILTGAWSLQTIG